MEKQKAIEALKGFSMDEIVDFHAESFSSNFLESDIGEREQREAILELKDEFEVFGHGDLNPRLIPKNATQYFNVPGPEGGSLLVTSSLFEFDSSGFLV